MVWFWQYNSSTRQEDKEIEKSLRLCFSLVMCMYKYIHVLVNLFLDIDVTRNRNNLKLKVKSEFSFSIGSMLNNHSNPYKHNTTILCDNV